MSALTIPDRSAAAERALSFLLRQEAVNNLMIAILLGGLWHPGSSERLYLALVERGDAVVAVALQNPIQYLLSPADDPDAVAVLAAHAHQHLAGVPRWLGPRREAAQFADAWRRLRGEQSSVRTRMRIYQADRIRPVADVPGELRLAQAEDREMLTVWRVSFAAATGSETTPEESARVVDRHLIERTLYLWHDAEPVSMAACGGTTPNGTRVNAVYTPPGTPALRLRQRRRRRAERAVARRGTALLLPLHRPGQPNVQCYLPEDWLPAGLRCRWVYSWLRVAPVLIRTLPKGFHTCNSGRTSPCTSHVALM